MRRSIVCTILVYFVLELLPPLTCPLYEITQHKNALCTKNSGGLHYVIFSYKQCNLVYNAVIVQFVEIPTQRIWIHSRSAFIKSDV